MASKSAVISSIFVSIKTRLVSRHFPRTIEFVNSKYYTDVQTWNMTFKTDSECRTYYNTTFTVLVCVHYMI